MSFDVFFQRFAGGEAVDGGNAEARAALSQHLVRDDSGRVIGLVSGAGTAELHGLEDDCGFTATRIGGTESWNLLYAAALAGGFTIMPVGCPVCVPDGLSASDLPSELQRGDVCHVGSGVELLEIVASA